MILKRISYTETRREAECLRSVFLQWYREHGHESSMATLERDRERMVALFFYPRKRSPHIPITYSVESPFDSLRLRTDAAKRQKRMDRAIEVVWKMVMVVKCRFRMVRVPVGSL